MHKGESLFPNGLHAKVPTWWERHEGCGNAYRGIQDLGGLGVASVLGGFGLGLQVASRLSIWCVSRSRPIAVFAFLVLTALGIARLREPSLPPLKLYPYKTGNLAQTLQVNVYRLNSQSQGLRLLATAFGLLVGVLPAMNRAKTNWLTRICSVASIAMFFIRWTGRF